MNTKGTRFSLSGIIDLNQQDIWYTEVYDICSSAPASGLPQVGPTVTVPPMAMTHLYRSRDDHPGWQDTSGRRRELSVRSTRSLERLRLNPHDQLEWPKSKSSSMAAFSKCRRDRTT
jgi:hypothetical protein